MSPEDDCIKTLPVNISQSVEASATQSVSKEKEEETSNLLIEEYSSKDKIDYVRVSLKKFECSFCTQSFHEKRLLRDHENVHKGSTPYICKQCGATFSRRTSLQIHQLVHDGKKLFQCSFCKQAFTRNADLKIHQRVHTGEQPFKCQVCAKTFKRKYGLNRHMRFHDEKNVFYCDLCDNVFFLTELGLQNHLSTVHKHSTIIKVEQTT